MKIYNIDKSMDITIDSYEFPYHETSDYTDNNWLNVKAVCEDEVLVEEHIDPCLSTEELADLLDGFSKALNDQPYESDFVEPTFYIEVKPLGEDCHLMASFRLENRIFDVVTIITKEVLFDMIEEVKQMMKDFPIRKKLLLN